MIQKDDIKLFVKDTLGCTCPDEVFDRIDCTADVKLPGGITLDYRINIGGRLLVFVINIDRFDSIAPILTQIVSAGIEDRNNARFNRFRLVLLTQHPYRLAEKASRLFEALKTDDKTHLHTIPEDNFPNTSN